MFCACVCAQRAKNLLDAQGNSTLTGLAVDALQRELPRARVVYSRWVREPPLRSLLLNAQADPMPGKRMRTGLSISLAPCGCLCSATGATEVHNLAYMRRLGSWGFESMDDLVKTLKK
jgi:hypothetical protein